MSNRLEEIPVDNWPELRDLYRRNWPEHVFAFGIVSNYLNWKQSQQHQDSLKVHIFSLNGTWKENGTFLLFDHFEIYFYSFETTTDFASLTDALLLVDWSKYHEVSMDFVEKHRKALDIAIRIKGLVVVNDELTNFYHIRKEDEPLVEVQLPRGFSLTRLSIDHLDYVYHQWPLKGSISEAAGYNLLKRLILLNESVGLFDENGKLLSWCLRDQTGAFSDLQTCEDHLRKGFARIVIQEFVRRLASMGVDSYAFVLRSNCSSCRLFESLGFRKITHLHWIVIRNERI